MRRSLKKKNDKKSKDSKKVEPKKKSTEPDNQKLKKTAMKTKSENGKSKNQIQAPQWNDNGSQISVGNYSKSSHSQSNERLNGKSKNREREPAEESHFESTPNRKPHDLIHRELSSVLGARSVNNSSNSMAQSSNRNKQKPMNDHTDSGSHNKAIKTFVPPLLSQGKHSTPHIPSVVQNDNTVQNQKLLSTTSLVWKTPSHETNSHYSYKESLTSYGHDNARSVSSHHIGDSISNRIKESKSADIRVASPGRHSNKSGAGSKAPSFSQLSSQLDSYENSSLSENGGSPAKISSGRSPQHSSSSNRPPSLYDNVIYKENGELKLKYGFNAIILLAGLLWFW